MSATGATMQSRALVRLFRLWAMSRESGELTDHRMDEVAAALGLADYAAEACVCLFELVEHTLERRLVRQCCCAIDLSPDEAAIAGLVASAPNLTPWRGSTLVPHSLPGSLHWAAMAVREALGFPPIQTTAHRPPAPDRNGPVRVDSGLPAVRLA